MTPLVAKSRELDNEIVELQKHLRLLRDHQRANTFVDRDAAARAHRTIAALERRVIEVRKQRAAVRQKIRRASANRSSVAQDHPGALDALRLASDEGRKVSSAL